MTRNAPDFSLLQEIVDGLCNGPVRLSSLQLAAEQVAAGNGASLFTALSRRIKAETPEGESNLRQLLEVLARVVDGHPGVGMYLMGRLYRITGNEHDVANSIELWADASHSLQSAESLERLAAELGPGLNRRFSAWAQKIRNDPRSS